MIYSIVPNMPNNNQINKQPKSIYVKLKNSHVYQFYVVQSVIFPDN